MCEIEEDSSPLGVHDALCVDAGRLHIVQAALVKGPLEVFGVLGVRFGSAPDQESVDREIEAQEGKPGEKVDELREVFGLSREGVEIEARQDGEGGEPPAVDLEVAEVAAD